MRCRVVVFACCVGCSGSDEESLRPDFDLRYTTEHFRLGTSFDAPLCAGTLALLERHAETLESELGTDLRRVDVYLYDEEPRCPHNDVSGCYVSDERIVLADWNSIRHEIVHALTYQWGTAAPLFSEGLAEAFDGKASPFDDTLPSSAVSPEPRDIDYAGARHFMRWLHAWRGATPIRELFRQRRPQDANGAFRAAFDIGLEEADELYFSDAMEVYPALEDCDVELLPWDRDVVLHELDVDCSAESTWGWANMLRSVAIEVASKGRYVVEVDPKAEVLVSACEARPLAPGEEPRESPARLDWLGHPTELDLEPGRYRLDVRLPAGAAETVGLRVAKATAVQGAP